MRQCGWVLSVGPDTQLSAAAGMPGELRPSVPAQQVLPSLWTGEAGVRVPLAERNWHSQSPALPINCLKMQFTLPFAPLLTVKDFKLQES